MAVRYDITDGPSKMDFMLSLFDGDTQHRRPVVFTLRGEGLTSFIIDGVEREDGSGENWIFKGSYYLGSISRILAHGFFSTRMRKGWIEY